MLTKEMQFLIKNFRKIKLEQRIYSSVVTVFFNHFLFLFSPLDLKGKIKTEKPMTFTISILTETFLSQVEV